MMKNHRLKSLGRIGLAAAFYVAGCSGVLASTDQVAVAKGVPGIAGCSENESAAVPAKSAKHKNEIPKAVADKEHACARQLTEQAQEETQRSGMEHSAKARNKPDALLLLMMWLRGHN